MIVPVIVGIGGLCCWKAFQQNRGVLTDERQKIYDNAMATLADPMKLRKLADAYQKVGLSYEADMLRKRAALREQPEEVKQARQEVFKKAMSSTNKEGISEVAAAFEKEGATGAAQKLREYLAGLM